VRRIVLHVPGGPSYDLPERRWRFLTPPETQALWAPRFGAHWIVATDGALWPRHPPPGASVAVRAPVGRPVDAGWRERLSAVAAPAYSHAYGANGDSVGIEVAHSGRSADPFPPAQVRSLAWLLLALIEMSEGRLGPASIAGHKDVDRRPAREPDNCARPECAMFVDDAGRAYRRRVDPPESLFAALAVEGLAIPRPADGDAELRRAEALGQGVRPRVVRP
jgi:hypothetical protein